MMQTQVENERYFTVSGLECFHSRFSVSLYE